MAGGDRERDVEEETRNQMMQNLFGDQSEDEEDDDEAVEVVDEDDHPHPQQQQLLRYQVVDDDDDEDDVRSEGHARSGYHSEEVEGEADNEGEGEAEGEGESEGQVGMEEESEAEAHQADLDQGESDGEKVQSSPEREFSDRVMQNDAAGMDSEDGGYQQRPVASGRRGVVASESEGSEDDYYAGRGHEDEEPHQTRKTPSSPVEEERDHEVVRDVFGESDEDGPAPYRDQHEIDEDSHRSPMEDEGHYEKDLQPEDVVADEDMRYESDENRELKPKEKPVGPPLNLVVPLKQLPAQPDRMNVIKVSNIMGIDPKPFDPKTYVEEDVFVTDESGTKKRIRLEDNIVRWRTVKNANGTTSCESNARIVKWKDGTMQLLIGNEVLDISVHEAHHDQSHLFLRNGKGVLQSQGRLLRKMRFMPSSLSSKSHRLLTALVDSQNKKTVKMQKWIESKDPEKVKQEKERALGQNIRAHSILQRKKEKVSRKYTQPARQRRQLSPGFLEDALDEDEEPDHQYGSRRMPARSRFEDELEAEALAERRIVSAKKSSMGRNIPRKPSFPARPPRRQANEYSESEREESEYETEGEDIEHSPTQGREDELDEEDEYEEDVEEEAAMSDEEIEEPKRRRESGGGSASQRRKEIDSDDDSPPRKQQAVHRRKAVVFDSDDE
ncbi:protein LEO1 homolog isoform X1 [Oryza glaberrima]|uniref:Leo1-like protein n=2 Tax=Oryza glaberrima TaxID=4538 RepID=I1Q7G5_ORYGL|nr:protein LEO1 homolog isoform X1 [Oryza glaberrima]